MTQRQPAIYIMANRRNGTLYTGVTNDLIRRVYQHKHGSIPGFTKQYNCTQLVYYEQCDEMIPAIEREKQISSHRKHQSKVDRSL